MDAKEYQAAAARTMLNAPNSLHPKDARLVYLAIGLCVEAGEAAESLKKAVFHGHALNLPKIESELGDVLWYVAGICSFLQLDLGAVMLGNVEKLRFLYPEGFSHADSIARRDVAQAVG